MLDDNNLKILQTNIIEELNLEALDENKKIALLDKMSEVVQKRLTLRVLNELDEAAKNEFEKILDESPEKMSNFLQTKIPNLVEIMQEEIIRLKKEMMAKN